MPDPTCRLIDWRHALADYLRQVKHTLGAALFLLITWPTGPANLLRQGDGGPPEIYAEAEGRPYVREAVPVAVEDGAVRFEISFARSARAEPVTGLGDC